jgi:hypothetical protein
MKGSNAAGPPTKSCRRRVSTPQVSRQTVQACAAHRAAAHRQQLVGATSSGQPRQKGRSTRRQAVTAVCCRQVPQPCRGANSFSKHVLCRHSAHPPAGSRGSRSPSHTGHARRQRLGPPQLTGRAPAQEQSERGNRESPLPERCQLADVLSSGVWCCPVCWPLSNLHTPPSH